MDGIRECPQELDETSLQAAAEAAYMAFQRDVRRTHVDLPEPRPFSETEGYLRDCYVAMCRAAFAAYGLRPSDTAASTAVAAERQRCADIVEDMVGSGEAIRFALHAIRNLERRHDR